MKKETYLYDNGNTIISYHKTEAGSKTLVVHFAPFGKGKRERDSWYGKVAFRAGFDVVSVREREIGWYQDMPLDDFLRSLDPVLHSYDKVVCYGESMGGYAALYYSVIINADCLAMSPLVSIHPKYPQFGWEEFRSKVNWIHTPLSLNNRYYNGRVLIAYDPTLEKDSIYINEEIRPVFRRDEYLMLHYSGHPVRASLNELGTLDYLILNFIKGHPTPCRRDLMHEKHKSPTYLIGLAFKAARQGKIKLAAKIYSQVVELNPNFKSSWLEHPLMLPAIERAKSFSQLPYGPGL